MAKLGRKVGSRNRTKIPATSEMVKHGVQSMMHGLEYLSQIIESEDKNVTIKNKMDAIKQVAEFLSLAGYGDELKVGHQKLIDKEGEKNTHRNSEEGDIVPQAEQGGATKPAEAEGNVLIGRFQETK